MRKKTSFILFFALIFFSVLSTWNSLFSVIDTSKNGQSIEGKITKIAPKDRGGLRFFNPKNYAIFAEISLSNNSVVRTVAMPGMVVDQSIHLQELDEVVLPYRNGEPDPFFVVLHWSLAIASLLVFVGAIFLLGNRFDFFVITGVSTIWLGFLAFAVAIFLETYIAFDLNYLVSFFVFLALGGLLAFLLIGLAPFRILPNMVGKSPILGWKPGKPLS